MEDWIETRQGAYPKSQRATGMSFMQTQDLQTNACTEANVERYQAVHQK
jgi:hypothetical protein